MNILWAYFWPVLVAGVVIGAFSAALALRRQRRSWIVIGAAALVATAALWHGPLGAADRFTGKVERHARAALEYYEMTQVTARLERSPLSRTLRFEGPADDFQRSELQRLFSDLPGVSKARFTPQWSVPLLLEAILAALAGFLAGALLAYLLELRRRYNAQWTW